MNAFEKLCVYLCVDWLRSVGVCLQLFSQFLVLVLQDLIFISDFSIVEVFAVVFGLQLVYAFLKSFDFCVFIGQLIEVASFILDDELVVGVYLSLFT